MFVSRNIDYYLRFHCANLDKEFIFTSVNSRHLYHPSHYNEAMITVTMGTVEE
jgi:hypothetical protein